MAENGITSEFTNILNKFSGGSTNTEELFATVRELLPFKEDEQFKIVAVHGKTDCFKADVNCCLSTLDEIRIFIDKYKVQNDETLRSRTAAKPGDKSAYVLSLYYRCHHRTTHVPSYNPVETLSKNPSKRLKNTDNPKH